MKINLFIRMFYLCFHNGCIIFTQKINTFFKVGLQHLNYLFCKIPISYTGYSLKQQFFYFFDK